MFAGSKKCTRNVSEVVTLFIGSKKCTRDVSEVMAVFMGSKECTRDSVGYSLSSWVKKNIPAVVLVAFRVGGFKKMHPQ